MRTPAGSKVGFFFVLSIPFGDWIIAWRSEKCVRRPLTYRIAVMGAVALLACSVLVNAEGGLLRSSICWNLKSHDVEGVDQNPALVWSWNAPQLVYALQAIRTEGLGAAFTRCPSGNSTTLTHPRVGVRGGNPLSPY